MCAITGWCGQLPRYFLSALVREMRVRGTDSTGVAFRHFDGTWKNTCCRQELDGAEFVAANENVMSSARRSLRGIAHTRRASPGMPINAHNAHPFKFNGIFFAHNGSIKNWRDLKEKLGEVYDVKSWRELKENAGSAAAAVSAQPGLELPRFVDSITTDSQVLGHYILKRDFSEVIGSMAIVWMKGPEVYVFRYGKEAVAARVTWQYASDLKGESVKAHDPQTFVVVGSTRQIIAEAIAATLAKCPQLEIDYDFMDDDAFVEDRVYRLAPDDLIDEGSVPVSARVTDVYTSEVVVQKSPPEPEPPSEIVE